MRSKAITTGYTLSSTQRESERLEMQALKLYGGFDYLIPFLKSGWTVLDVGCGTGAACRAIAKNHYKKKIKRIVGIDADAGRVKTAKKSTHYSRIRYEIGNAYEIPFPDDSFDLVTCRFVLMHLNEPMHAIKEMYRVTKHGGLIVAHEGYHKEITFVPRKPNLEKIVRAWEKEMERRGEDPSLGPKLYRMFAKVGLSNVSLTVVPHLTVGSDELHHLYIKNWREHLPSLKITLKGKIAPRTFKDATVELSKTTPYDLYYETTFIASGKKKY